MFSVTVKSSYAISAIFELAKNHGKGLIQIKDLVKRRNIPKNYLEQIFNRLGKHGIVKSVRGNRGGYELGNHPSKITLFDVLVALEGQLELHNFSEIDVIRDIYKEIEDDLLKKMSISLADLVHRQQSYNRPVMYHI